MNELTGWFIPVEHPRATVLFCHGNGGNISLLIESVRMFHSLQLNVLVFDYRGYGRSEGSPDEEGTYADAEAAWHYLTDTMGVPPAKILVVGRSLGGAIAAWLTARNTPAALVIESSFTSLPDLASELYPWLPVRILTRYAYDTEGSLASVHCPVLVIHSRDDEVIPFTHGEELFGAVQTQKTFLEIRGRHNEGFLLSSKAYLGAIDTLLRSALKTEPATRDERSAGSHSRQIP